jgi:tetratricopeptide (TPR) repeat protein
VLYANLATVYLALDRLDEAERNCRAALALQPALASAHFCLGVLMHRRDRLDEAAQAFCAARRSDPVHGDAHRRVEARPAEQRFAIIVQMRDLLKSDPIDVDAHSALGHTLLADGQPDEALVHLGEAARRRPEVAQTHAALGYAHQELDQMAEAVACFRVAEQLQPADIQIQYDLGNALETMGRGEEATSVFQSLLARHPNDIHAMTALAKLAVGGDCELPADVLAQLHALAARPDLPLPDACRVFPVLAQLLDHRGQYDAAFEYARRANAARSTLERERGTVYDPDEHRRFIDRLIAFFAPQYFARVRGFGVGSEVPVFVVGMIRSGTSLVEQILASHPQAYGAGELRDIALLTADLQRRLRRHGAHEPAGQASGESETVAWPLARSASSPGAQPPPRIAGSYLEYLPHVDAALTRELADEYLRKLQQRSGDAIRVADKNPMNFAYLGLIATLLPRARIIHCRRDPRDICLSCYFRDFQDPFPFKHDLRHLAAYYLQYERLMAHWHAVLPLQILDVQYESLIADPESTTRRLLSICGLPWDERCLRFHENDRPVRTASRFQVRQPIYQSAVGRWKHYEAHLGPLLAALHGN